MGVHRYARAQLIPHPPTAICFAGLFGILNFDHSTLLSSLLPVALSIVDVPLRLRTLPTRNKSPPWACLEFGSGGLVRDWRCNAQPSVVVEGPATECLCEIPHPATMADIEATRSSPITAEAALEDTHSAVSCFLDYCSPDLNKPSRHTPSAAVAQVDNI